MIEIRSCVKVEVAILGSPSLISLRVSVDVFKSSMKEDVHNAGTPCGRGDDQEVDVVVGTL